METYDSRWVAAQVEQTSEVWRDSAAKSPGKARRYDVREQQQSEKAYDEALKAAESDLKRVRKSAQAAPAARSNQQTHVECEGPGRVCCARLLKSAQAAPAARSNQQTHVECEGPGRVCCARLLKSGTKRIGVQDRLVSSFSRFAAKALDLDGKAIALLTGEFLPVGTQLARLARQFDAGLSMSDIIQAARNAWTACGLQPLLGERVSLTPAIFGYSLLYPYSDNYLDDEAASGQQKLQFSQRFRRRLLGEKLAAANAREQALAALIGLIEEQYPRVRFPQVFQSLLAIHQAQEDSMGQTRCPQLATDAETLRLSCAKGGTSVLADACLSHGWLDAEESRFAFEWGVLLQLGDDLQDVRDDLRRGSITLFSSAVVSGRPLDGVTLQLLNFSDAVGRRMDLLPHGTSTLKKLLKMSWRSLIIRAIADSHQFFSPGFLEEAEACSPFRFEFLRERKDRLAGRQGLYATLFDALLESPQDDLAASVGTMTVGGLAD